MSGSRFTMSRDRLAELRVSIFVYSILSHKAIKLIDRAQTITKNDTSK